MYNCDKARLQNKIDTFSKFGDTGTGGITRLSLSEPALQARAEFKKRCEDLGMEFKTDDMGNMYTVHKGEEDLPAIVMGSHLDSVVNGGNFDGVLGVLTALEVAETIVSEKIKTRGPIAVMVWTNEEGSRFDPAMMSSGVVTGKFDKATMLNSKDKEGTAFGEALKASGYAGAEKNRLNADDYAGYFELHIEQGPVLEAEAKDIGVVEGVVGMINYEIDVKGVSDHAGTTPQKTRKDALYAASKIIIDLWEKLGKINPELVFTMGRINASPNIHTVIPKEVRFTLDARHKDPKIIERAAEVIKALPAEVAKCQVSYRQLWGRKTIEFNKDYVAAVQRAADGFGYSSRKIYSGAGHDAQYVADVMPATMIFVPSVNGHSHCVEEFTPTEAALKGANVLLNAVLEIDKNYRGR
ncbi:MAG: Zn-dependent hydrolase [Clostridiales Family XIII bacterium]|jgi:N-carbamoyl-L-amino-acid hydrolase|nr:Zn-dependent hydrolase [Clostridiales Family XIII bacterium]